MNSSNQSNTSSKSIGAGLLVAFTASLCCITPVFSLLAGISGIATTFSWVEPFRPYLIGLTVLVLAFAWYQKLKPKTDEEIECACEDDEQPSFWHSKKFLGIVTVLAALMLAFPGYSHIFYPKTNSPGAIIAQDSRIKLATFKIKGMTCRGCESHVTNAVDQLEGVKQVVVSYEQGNAVVKYNPNQIETDQIVETINKTGYKVVEKPNNQ